MTNDAKSIVVTETMAAAGKPIAVVCHAPAVLINAKAANGASLVKGKTVTGFSNTEEDAVQLTNLVPFLLEDAPVAKGGVGKNLFGGNEHLLIFKTNAIISDSNFGSNGSPFDKREHGAV